MSTFYTNLPYGPMWHRSRQRFSVWPGRSCSCTRPATPSQAREPDSPPGACDERNLPLTANYRLYARYRLAKAQKLSPAALFRLDIAADQQVIEAADAIPAVPVGLKHDAMLPLSVSSTMIF
jgi:hypothetical protein